MTRRDTPSSRKQVAYLAGPMRGIPEYNFPAFYAAADALRKHGLDVWSPAEHDVNQDGFDPAKDTAQPMRHYMRRDLPAVLDADIVCVLPGWEKSQGAQLEVHVAQACGIPVYSAHDFSPASTVSEKQDSVSAVSSTRRIVAPHVDGQDFYELCQQYRHAKEMMPLGVPNVVQAFDNLREYIKTGKLPWPSHEGLEDCEPYMREPYKSAIFEEEEYDGWAEPERVDELLREIIQMTDSEGIKRKVGEVREALKAPRSAIALKTVWLVSNKTSMMLFDSRESASEYVSSFSASVGGGLRITSMDVFSTTDDTGQKNG